MNKYSALICVFEKMNISGTRQEGYQKTDILSYRPFKLQISFTHINKLLEGLYYIRDNYCISAFRMKKPTNPHLQIVSTIRML